MEYVSLEKSRAGWQPDQEKPREKSRPQTPAVAAASKTNPDGGSSASNPEEG